MTNPRDPDGSYRIGDQTGHTTSTSGADVTDRMTGTSRTTQTDTRTTPAPGHAKTSAAAAFGLVFGLAALFCALTAILAPAAVVFGILGIIIAAAGMAMSKRPGVTGRGVAIGGLVTAILGLLLGGAVLGGLAAVVNNENAVNRISTQLDKIKEQLPSGTDVQNGVNSVTK